MSGVQEAVTIRMRDTSFNLVSLIHWKIVVYPDFDKELFVFFLHKRWLTLQHTKTYMQTHSHINIKFYWKKWCLKLTNKFSWLINNFNSIQTEIYILNLLFNSSKQSNGHKQFNDVAKNHDYNCANWFNDVNEDLGLSQRIRRLRIRILTINWILSYAITRVYGFSLHV